MRDRYKVLFIIFVSLGIYYPSIFGSVNSTDDYSMITNLMNMERIDWKGLFLPESSVYYYRPLLMLSFVFDMRVFDCHEFFMHLENILVHTANGVLVFFILKEIQRIFRITADSYIPMFSALLFILHPINTEAVNWISGRTDVMAGLFVFLSFLIFLKKGMQSYIWYWISAFFYLMGLLSKEVAIGLLPAIGLFLVLKEKPVEDIGIKNKLKLFFPFFVFTIIYFLMRMPSGHIDSGISTAVNVSEDRNFIRDIGSAIKAFGFYFKKLFIPLPLNFGIININRTFYLWFGFITTGISIYFLVRRRILLSFFLFFSVLFFLPAIPVAISKMAWTPLAERYLYISSFGASALIILIINRLPWGKGLIYGVLAILLITSAVITVKRNVVWQDDLVFYGDTIKISPSFASGRNEYGIALFKRGRFDEALEQFKVAARLSGDSKYKELTALNVVLLSEEDKLEEAKKKYRIFLKNSQSPKIVLEILHKLIEITEKQAKDERNLERRKELYREFISYFEQLYKLEGNSFYLYKQGQYYIALGEKEKAFEFFKKTTELSQDEYYSEPARKLAKKLESEINN